MKLLFYSVIFLVILSVSSCGQKTRNIQEVADEELEKLAKEREKDLDDAQSEEHEIISFNDSLILNTPQKN